MPSTREFVIISFLLYYDLGFLLEAAGIRYINEFFPSVFVAPDRVLALSILVIAVSPWFLDLSAGSWKWRSPLPPEVASRLRPGRQIVFHVVMCVICLSCIGLAMTVAKDSLVIWSARSAIGEVLGPYVLVLLVPVYILAFYVRQRDSHSAFGFIFVTFLVLCSILATLPVGERTFVILPFVIVFLFWKRISIHSLVITGVAGVLAAALLLPIFKMQESGNSSGSDLLLSSLNGDISRAPILADVLSDSALFGTRVMDYPGAGYVYSALYFVPRSLVPFKGQSTAVQYTAHTEHTSPDDTNWGLGISAVDELLLNFGIIFLPIGLLLYGYAIRQADRASQRIPSLTVPTRLTAVFLLGYHLPALLQDFGAMAITIFALHVLFARLEPVSTSVSI